MKLTEQDIKDIQDNEMNKRYVEMKRNKVLSFQAGKYRFAKGIFAWGLILGLAGGVLSWLIIGIPFLILGMLMMISAIPVWIVEFFVSKSK